MSLLTRLLLLVLMAVLPAVAIQAYNEVELRQIREAQVHDEALRLARLANSEMDRIAEGTRQLLIAFAENPAISTANWQACDDAAAHLLSRLNGYANLAVVAANGDVVCSARPQGRGASISAWPFFKRASATEDFAVGSYEVSDISGARVLPFTEPLRDAEGRKTGFAWATLDLDWLARDFGDRFASEDVTLALGDEDGTILLRLPDNAQWVGRKFDDKYRPMLHASAEGSIEIAGMDGIVRIIGYSPVTIEPRGIYVGVGLTKSAFFADINRATIRGAVLVALALCLALAAAWAGGTAFVRRPVGKLLEAAGRWRHGDYAARTGVTGERSEIGRLGRAFDDMAKEVELREGERRRAADELRRFSETLEQRVAERTAELVETNRRLAVESEERRRAEAALQHAQRIESIGQLTGGIAHDFNNLLTAVLGNLELAQFRVKDESVLRLLAGASRAAERGARLTQHLLAFSRKQHLDRRSIDVNGIVRGMSDMLQRSIGTTVHIEHHLAPDLWPAMTDPNQIELVILNLAINARDAMPLGGSLLIETMNSASGDPKRPSDLAGDHVLLAVSDTGTGMTEEVMAKALEPFFTTKETGKGSGLGLSMVYGVAKQSGGGIALSSGLGRGTTVRVYLPRAAVAAVGAAERATPAVDAQGLGGRSVLLIDDDPDVRQTTARLLADLDCRVVEAESGRAGLAAIERDRFDLVVVDFAMPGMNGIDVAGTIIAKCPDMPIVIITGYADVDLKDAARHGLYLLKKPFQRAELAESLLAALGHAAPGPDNVVPLRRAEP